MTKFKQKNFKEAIKGSGGIQSVVAQKLNVTRGRISQYVLKYPKMKELLEKEREKVIDKAEHKLFEAADKGEKWAIERILRTIGKDRGYGDHQELDISGTSATFNLIEKSVEEIKDAKVKNKGNKRPDNKSETSRDSQSSG